MLPDVDSHKVDHDVFFYELGDNLQLAATEYGTKIYEYPEDGSPASIMKASRQSRLFGQGASGTVLGHQLATSTGESNHLVTFTGRQESGNSGSLMFTSVASGSSLAPVAIWSATEHQEPEKILRGLAAFLPPWDSITWYDVVEPEEKKLDLRLYSNCAKREKYRTITANRYEEGADCSTTLFELPCAKLENFSCPLLPFAIYVDIPVKFPGRCDMMDPSGASLTPSAYD